MINFKHVVHNIKLFTLRLFCSHKTTSSATCPFTGLTYVDCSNCGKRTGVISSNG